MHQRARVRSRSRLSRTHGVVNGPLDSHSVLAGTKPTLPTAIRVLSLRCPSLRCGSVHLERAATTLNAAVTAGLAPGRRDSESGPTPSPSPPARGRPWGPRARAGGGHTGRLAGRGPESRGGGGDCGIMMRPDPRPRRGRQRGPQLDALGNLSLRRLNFKVWRTRPPGRNRRDCPGPACALALAGALRLTLADRPHG